MQFLSLFAAITFSFASVVSGAVLSSRKALDVFVPTIISPNASTVWVMGTNATVFWDPSNAPVNISNRASVYLRHWGYLAKGFSLRDGNVTVPVPFIPSAIKNPDEKQHIILFGDSGNESEAFTVKFDPDVFQVNNQDKWD
ncbi:hypothetical protein C0993_011912 [Termitomyces sp. T159_Od127]|nr:hypothetical protein C0993_011912 [Termitomyces sp. T159_Od127]